MKALELGCGPGANLWFLHREGFSVAGIDSSSTAIAIAGERLLSENQGINDTAPDLRAGNFAALEWKDASFDLAVDIFAIYANTLTVMDSAISEIYRVLKPGAFFTPNFGAVKRKVSEKVINWRKQPIRIYQRDHVQTWG